MAESQDAQTSSSTASPRPEAERPSQTKSASSAGKTIESEARSFGENGGRAVAEGAAIASQAARQAVDTGRHVAATGRQASHEVADLWRNSLEPLPAMQLEMRRAFDDFWRGAFALSGLPSLRTSRPFAAFAPTAVFGQPAADVKETDQAYLLNLEAPGLNADDLDLSIDGDMLVICGHKAEDREEAAATYRISERQFGRFERRFPIAADVVRQGIEAAYRNGVLRITLPRRAEQGRSRSQIPIKS